MLDLLHIPSIKIILTRKNLKIFHCFWDKNPALFWGLSLLLGAASGLCCSFLFLVFFTFLALTAKSITKALFGLFCFVLSLINTTLQNPSVSIPNGKVQGTGTFHIQDVKSHSSPFSRSILYKGILRNFGSMTSELPCHIYLPFFSKHPPATTDYTITGTLLQKNKRLFVLKPDKNSIWTPVKSPYNLAQWRFNAKEWVHQHLKKEIQNPDALNFLTALTTGTIEERFLSMEFGKVGLQHILAISGFHFALFALFLTLFLRLFFPHKICLCLLIAALTLYYLFLGHAPSIQRAYIAIVLFAIGKLFSLRISGLNALGAALCIEVLLSPAQILELGFQLSFLCTLSILLFYPSMLSLFSLLLPKRSYSAVQSMSLIDKSGYLLTAILRKALALNCAVHLITLPVLLYLFHKFPLLSFVYNLFFPPCVCLCMFLLFFSFLCAPWLHILNNAWTSWILHFTSNVPAFLDFSIHISNLNLSVVLCFLLLSFFVGIFFFEKAEKKSP